MPRDPGALTDLEFLARKYDPNYERPQPFDHRPRYTPTGNLRRDVYDIIANRREDNLVAIGRILGVSDWVISQQVQRFVKEGVFTQEQVYHYLPKIKEAHERRERQQARRSKQVNH